MADIKRLVQEGTDAYNQKKIGVLDGLYQADAELIIPGREPVRGRAAVTAFWEEEFKSFPDGKVKIVTEVISGSTAVSEWEWNGTNTGPLRLPTGDMSPATGKKASAQGVDIAEFEGGLIKSHRFYYDSLSLVTQLGLVPAMEASS